MSASDAFYQTAKGGLTQRLENAEQIAQGRRDLLTSQQAQQLTLKDDLDHANANRDTSIFGISLGAAGGFKSGVGLAKTIGGKILSRQTARLQTAIDEYRRQQGQLPPTDEQQEPQELTEFEPPQPEAAPEAQPPVAETSFGAEVAPVRPTPTQVTSGEGLQETGTQQDIMGLDPEDLNAASQNIRAAARPNVSALSDSQNARLSEIQSREPILSEENVGQLKNLGLDFGDLSPAEVSQGAEALLGDEATSRLSTLLDVGSSAVGGILSGLGSIGDIAGLVFAGEGLGAASQAADVEKQEQQKLTQAIAQTNIPLQVAPQGSAPVMDSSTNRVGGFLNY